MGFQLGPRQESLSSYSGQHFLPAFVVWVHGGEWRAVAGNRWRGTELGPRWKKQDWRRRFKGEAQSTTTIAFVYHPLTIGQQDIYRGRKQRVLNQKLRGSTTRPKLFLSPPRKWEHSMSDVYRPQSNSSHCRPVSQPASQSMQPASQHRLLPIQTSGGLSKCMKWCQKRRRHRVWGQNVWGTLRTIGNVRTETFHCSVSTLQSSIAL